MQLLLGELVWMDNNKDIYTPAVLSYLYLPNITFIDFKLPYTLNQTKQSFHLFFACFLLDIHNICADIFNRFGQVIEGSRKNLTKIRCWIRSTKQFGIYVEVVPGRSDWHNIEEFIFKNQSMMHFQKCIQAIEQLLTRDFPDDPATLHMCDLNDEWATFLAIYCKKLPLFRNVTLLKH